MTAAQNRDASTIMDLLEAETDDGPMGSLAYEMQRDRQGRVMRAALRLAASKINEIDARIEAQEAAAMAKVNELRDLGVRLDDVRDRISRQEDASAERLKAIEALGLAIAHNTKITEGLVDITVEIAAAVKGARWFTRAAGWVIGRFTVLLKWVGGIATALVGLWALWDAFFKGGPPGAP